MNDPLNRRLQALMAPGAGTLLPGAGNALTARFIAAAGFEAVFVSGAAVANWHLGKPDVGLTSITELVDHERDATYFRDPSTNVSFGIKIINQQQYDGIAVKTVTSTYPQVLWVNMTYPNIEMYIYPVPTRLLEWHFISVQELTQPATLATEFALPPGYLRAFVYNLAMEMAPEFGVEPSPQVQRIAMTSKRNLKRINNPDDIMSMPYSIVATRQRFNIFAGNY